MPNGPPTCECAWPQSLMAAQFACRAIYGRVLPMYLPVSTVHAFGLLHTFIGLVFLSQPSSPAFCLKDSINANKVQRGRSVRFVT